MSCVYLLAVITPAVFSTVYVCYLTGVQLKKLRLVWLSYVLACDELTLR